MTEGKREQPFGLDMNFAEALQRFSQTDAAELPQSKNSQKPRKRRMSRDGEPFVFTLLDAEIKQITETETIGSGGLQSLPTHSLYDAFWPWNLSNPAPKGF